jgi:hypothetical protein
MNDDHVFEPAQLLVFSRGDENSTKQTNQPSKKRWSQRSATAVRELAVSAADPCSHPC